MNAESGEDFLDELRREGYKKWWRFGWRRSPVILWKRSRLAHFHPFRELRYGWQRARRGYSDRDVWGFSDYLNGVIRCGVRDLAHMGHGHPTELTWGEWAKVLAEIQEGMWAAHRLGDASLGYNEEDRARDQAYFDTAMEHLHKWWFNLWD